jgi:hypothetical protein
MIAGRQRGYLRAARDRLYYDTMYCLTRTAYSIGETFA